MSKLEDLKPNAAVRGILPDSLVTVVSVEWFGTEALEFTYKDTAGKVSNQLLYRRMVESSLSRRPSRQPGKLRMARAERCLAVRDRGKRCL